MDTCRICGHDADDGLHTIGDLCRDCGEVFSRFESACGAVVDARKRHAEACLAELIATRGEDACDEDPDPIDHIRLRDWREAAAGERRPLSAKREAMERCRRSARAILDEATAERGPAVEALREHLRFFKANPQHEEAALARDWELHGGRDDA